MTLASQFSDAKGKGTDMAHLQLRATAELAFHGHTPLVMALFTDVKAAHYRAIRQVLCGQFLDPEALVDALPIALVTPALHALLHEPSVLQKAAV
eukprot:8945345-Lingulodinium_polyedra.AAC.1